jgi:hypothetical protein
VTRRLLVVAVDGVLADTLPRRAAALDEAMQAITGRGLAGRGGDADVAARIAGRDWAELARLLAEPDDETQVDLIALASERAYARHLALGLPPLALAAVARAREAAERGWRVVLRADSSHRAAAPLLEALAERTLAARVLAGDAVRATPARRLCDGQLATLTAAARAAPAARLVEYGPPPGGARLPHPWVAGWPAD